MEWSSCVRCGWVIPDNQPLFFCKVPTRNDRHYIKSPCCEDCIGDEFDNWGAYEAIVNGRVFQRTTCCECHRLMVTFVGPYNRWDSFSNEGNIACSRRCQNRASRRRALRALS